ncbi:MAG: BrnT family toxin [Thermoanaerobaculia bacterium]
MIPFNFEWDPAKAKANQKKHGISFEQATGVFRDSRAISVFDEDHSEEEARWITLGATTQGTVMVVVHTFRELGNKDEATLRIISARGATRRERKDYEANL